MLSTQGIELERSTAIPGVLSKFGEIILREESSSCSAFTENSAEGEEEVEDKEINLKGFDTLIKSR